MEYSFNHLALAFMVGFLVGNVSSYVLRRQGVTIESSVSLVILSVWLSMHMYGFLFSVNVPWLMDFAGFGAAGNFIGLKVADLKFFSKLK